MKRLRVQLLTLALALAALAATSGFLAGRRLNSENGTVRSSNSIRTGQGILISEVEAVTERKQWLASVNSTKPKDDAEKTLRELEARRQWNEFLTRVRSGLRDKRKLDRFGQQPLAPDALEAEFLGAFIPNDEVAALATRLEELKAKPDADKLKEVENDLVKLRDRVGSFEKIKEWAQTQLDKYQGLEK